jgi:adenylate cyclase
VVRAWDPLPLQQLRWLAFDTYQRLAPRAYDPAMPVKIVDLDEDSLARIGQWPWPRTYLATLLGRLGASGVAAVAFDVVFAEPDRSSPEQALKLWPATLEVLSLRDSVAVLPSHDDILADAIEQTPVVTGFVLTQGRPGAAIAGAAPLPGAASRASDPLAAWALAGASLPQAGEPETSRLPEEKAKFAIAGDDPKRFVPQFNSAVPNLARLEAAALGNGAINSTPDIDQVIRRVPLLLTLDDKLYP